ncbi:MULTISPECIES: Rrf2 family transcriptional regulator [unclassified Staphylococcus]|uniref:Rrf2 family transcriptional regulator n=2 Tax=Staphylococcus TaxID=1279 RepID=UPI0021D30659|nr:MULTISPECIES: Rrf2 family transcriptional regulator [unclassified Staphylococcus]UXR73806.1 Rrf2 family transcriptional regulator [Staphylococcus sp. IVB6238]UXR76125.1 Rrf2 family transcriptional regulator [Staphylococcus sp. IVB6233]UXR80322.1 Rrf2 family transcriptional regulator [Staphylococcus sp. IVB6218]
MSISSRFSIGIHILTLIETTKDEVASSEYIAGSVNANPAMIRKIMGMLKKAGLIDVRPGVAGAQLSKNLTDITLLDIYKAVDAVKDDELFNIHENPNPNCEVGRNIQATIEPIFHIAQNALEQVLENVTIDAIIKDVESREKQQLS